MYRLAAWKKADPLTRWNLPDRIFFGHGACHILAGVFLAEAIDTTFRAYWVRPKRYPGEHVFVSDGEIAFDYHGYSARTRLVRHHRKVWRCQYSGWEAVVVPVDFDLLDETELNQRNMRGPEQYLCNPIERARQFIARIDHAAAPRKARDLAAE